MARSGSKRSTGINISIGTAHVSFSIFRILTNRRFFITKREQQVIEAFLRAPTLPVASYDSNSPESRTRGIPQGTSISLFLANVAAYLLDRRLESLGVGFARYADDTLIWSDNYSDICRAVNALEEVGFDMGVELNLVKSDGISILGAKEFPAEFSPKSSVAFLGYRITTDTISIRETNLVKTKARLAYLIYSNLLQSLKHGFVVPDRVTGGIDRDYIVMLYQIRRYLYGELRESQLRKYLARQTPLIRYHGLMSFYPIVDDDPLLKDFDGWLLNSVYRALKLRAKLLQSAGVGSVPPPHGLSKRQILQLRYKQAGGQLRDLRFPSIARVARLIRRAARTYGASAVANPQSSKYHFS
jgi:RNA-directed DNA polymerase